MTTIDFNPADKILKQFAAALAAFACVVGAINVLRHGVDPALVSVFAAVLVFSGLALFWPKLVRWPFITASLVTFPIGLVVSFVMLCVFYFFVITPIGLILRITGRDSLRLDRSKESAEGTYWIQRPTNRPLEYYLSQ